MATGVWTNNWQALRNTMLLGGIYPGLNTITNTDGSTVSASTAPYFAASPMGAYALSQQAMWRKATIRLGTGTNVPAAGDYTIAEAANLGYLSIGSIAPEFDTNTHTMTRTVTLTVQYNGTGTITLTEWGLFGCPGSKTGNSINGNNVLIYRELFDTPVVLSQYQAAALEVNLSMTLSNPL